MTTINWRNAIARGDIMGEWTLFGMREILVATQPKANGCFEGVILTGPDASATDLYAFNVIEAAYARKPNPNELDGFTLIA